MTATVLAVDDSIEVLAVVATRLKPDGYRVITVTNWQKAFELALTELPDLILLDVNMPDASGLDVCCRLKADPQTAEIPVIFLTASDDVELKVHGFDVGATDYVTKPFHPAELRARVRAALRAKKVQNDLGELARLDALTGLRNRGQFDHLLASTIKTCSVAHRDMSLLLLDLDHFKAMNDQHGHAFGDSVLRGIGKLLTTGARRGDYTCRYGGEELAIILPDADIDAAVEVGERFRAGLAALEFETPKGVISVTASFGVASLSEVFRHSGVVTPLAMVHAADEALYAAKRDGRNRVVAYPRPRRSAQASSIVPVPTQRAS